MIKHKTFIEIILNEFETYKYLTIAFENINEDKYIIKKYEQEISIKQLKLKIETIDNEIEQKSKSIINKILKGEQNDQIINIKEIAGLYYKVYQKYYKKDNKPTKSTNKEKLIIMECEGI